VAAYYFIGSKLMKTRNKMMFMLTQDLQSPSGIGRYFPLCKNLVKQGYDVTVAALHSQYGSLEERTLIKEGVKISYVAQMHVKKENNQTVYFQPSQLVWYSIVATWRLFIYLLKHPVDIVVICKPHPMNSIAGLLGGALTRAKILLDCDDYEAASNTFRSAWQRWVVMVFENWMPKLVHHVTTNTLFNKRRMIAAGIPAEKIDYIPNGVDLDRFQMVGNEQGEYKLLNPRFVGQKVIAYIGSLNLNNHPVDLLIEAFQIIASKMQAVFLLVVGGGKDIEKLQKLSETLGIQDRVIFEGRVSPDLIPHYYQMADVSVDPVYDTDAAKGRCPLKLFESWVMDTPMITSDVGDRGFLAGTPPALRLVKPGDKEDLAKHLMAVLNDIGLAKTLVKQGQKRLPNYSWERLAEEFSSILIQFGNSS
jgi:glycosyltransferase involved in cell wall biosynthesis